MVLHVRSRKTIIAVLCVFKMHCYMFGETAEENFYADYNHLNYTTSTESLFRLVRSCVTRKETAKKNGRVKSGTRCVLLDPKTNFDILLV